MTIRAFVRSVTIGSLAGAVPMLLLTVPLALFFLPGGANGRLSNALWLAVLPLVISFPIVLGASIVIGLPLTLFLRRRRWESGVAYGGVGGVVGFLIPLIGLSVAGAPGGYWTAILGAAGGVATGGTWWTSARRAVARPAGA